MSALDGLIETYEMRTGNTTKAALEELAQLRAELDGAKETIRLIAFDLDGVQLYSAVHRIRKYLSAHPEEK